eukprot:GHVU01080216.1.p1 GENE.GHVU01080216.1~~GHVU01080216.1.p1  ORF type:complete len:469 (-),score=72.88 GHVU01080216.1:1525-2931(-)
MKTYVILASLLVVCLAKSREHHGPNPEEMFPDPGPPEGCPMEPMCATRCKYGLKKDDKGCDTCECNPSPCEGFQCEGNTVCIVSYMDCMMDAPCFGHPKCVPPKPCSNMMCMMACPFGNKIDEFGCQICECKEGPEPPKQKEGIKCGENMCLAGQHCMEGKRCAIKPWCHRMTDFYKMMMELRRQNKPDPALPVPGMAMQHHEPQCEHDGAFKPKQCHDKHCWCVHENGTEIEGSRIPFLVRGEPMEENRDEEKHCEKNKTIGARIKFHMRHNLENVDNRMDHIKKLVHEHMARWMTISREDILQVNVRTGEIHLLQIEVIVVHNGRTDLASALMHFHEHFAKQHLNVEVEPGKILEPVPKSVTIDRQFEPKRHIVTCWNRVKAFYHHYPVAVISGSVAAGLLLLLAVIATTLACCCKAGRRHQRYEIKNYDKNLSFANQLYNYPEVVTGDEKTNLSDKEKEAQDTLA